MNTTELERLRDLAVEQRERWEEAVDCLNLAVKAVQAAHSGNGGPVLVASKRVKTHKNGNGSGRGRNYMQSVRQVFQKPGSDTYTMGALWTAVRALRPDLPEAVAPNFYSTVGRNAAYGDSSKPLEKVKTNNGVVYKLRA